jgi:FkbH-like protein
MVGMRSNPELYWLPQQPPDWRRRVTMLSDNPVKDWSVLWAEAVALAKFRLSFPSTNALDVTVQGLVSQKPDRTIPPCKLAFLSSSTSSHLAGGLRVGALRRGIALEIYEPIYDQYRQDLANPRSGLYQFDPTIVLFAFDAVFAAAHALEAKTIADAARLADEFVNGLRKLWTTASERTGASIIQQTIMPHLPYGAGNNEHRLPTSGSAFISRVNERIRDASDEAGIDLLALDTRVVQDGIDCWFSPGSWYGAKQEVALPASPMYGDMVARLIAARQGRSAKCCVFDLDNTLWGGIIGDDGVNGIVVGAGSAAGEAFLNLQNYAIELRRRGVILAVCSKNDEAIAVEPFESHPYMALKRQDVTCFVANWQDKPSNLRAIAHQLNIGLDSLVFVDDSPFERELVRQSLPEVFVPEVPNDPALIPRCLSDAGCFEMVALTDEDVRRASSYAENARREAFKNETVDLKAYLAGLNMVLRWNYPAELDIGRVTQLVNKTNQFNLTTRRLNESDVRAATVAADTAVLQFRLVDRFGDNGVIGIVIGHMTDDTKFTIDDWLMSCRVLGRQVEDAMLNVLASVARRMGASQLNGMYRPTKRNSIVADLLARLGFSTEETTNGIVVGIIDLAGFIERQTAIRIERNSP